MCQAVTGYQLHYPVFGGFFTDLVCTSVITGIIKLINFICMLLHDRLLSRSQYSLWCSIFPIDLQKFVKILLLVNIAELWCTFFPTKSTLHTSFYSFLMSSLFFLPALHCWHRNSQNSRAMKCNLITVQSKVVENSEWLQDICPAKCTLSEANCSLDCRHNS